jgi:ESS family glutamate:Na+ symporter
LDGPLLSLNLIHTMAFGGVVLYCGYAMRRSVPLLARYNLPAPVLGGLLVAVAVCTARQQGLQLFHFDTTLREPMMIAFFTTVGFGASWNLLQAGGPLVLRFFALCTAVAVLQNLLGAGVATLTGKPPLLGVLCGSVTLTGGPATGLAFAEQFEAAGVTGAGPIAVAFAMLGIVTGGLIGTPIATRLIERLNRKQFGQHHQTTPSAEQIVAEHLPSQSDPVPVGEDPAAYALLKSVGVILVAMWVGTLVSAGFVELRLTLPNYIGAMLVAAVMRNVDDATGWLSLSQRSIDEVGNVALSFFLVLAMMTLELHLLAGVALPLFAILIVQVLLIALFAVGPVFKQMGSDFDAAVTVGGFCGFMMGTTANAMANMDSLTRRYGPAKRAYLVVPIVGALFIDFANALLIQICLNWFA